MTLFAVLGVPCLTLFVLALTGGRPQAAGRGISQPKGSLTLAFVKGFFYAVPCLVVMLLLRRYVPLSYRSLRLYLYLLCAEHLIPVAFLWVFYFLACSRRPYRELLLFGGGFYTLLQLVEIFAQYGQYDPYQLFLLPALRMASLLFLTIFFLRYQEWYGVVRALFLILLVLLPLLSGGISYLYMGAHLPWAAAAGGLFLLGSVFYTVIEQRS